MDIDKEGGASRSKRSWSQKGLVIGICLGAALGAFLGNLSIGIAVGIALGLGCGSIFDGRIKSRKD